MIIILADDLGYGDVQCNNPERGKIPTPHVNQLAAEGIRFTDGHSSSGCCSPSRYTLLTGRYHWRTRLQSGIVGQWEKPLIAANRATIADLAKAKGYTTAAIGKWHLGWDWPIEDAQRMAFKVLGEKTPAVSTVYQEAWKQVFSQSIPGGPLACGFDHYFGTDVPNWPPFCFIKNDRTIGIPSEFLPAALLNRSLHASQQGPALPNWKLEAILPALTKEAVSFIETSSKQDQPFLLYMPLTTPHTPLAVNEAFKGKSGIEHPAADLIMETDDAVGQVLAALNRSHCVENTLVIFTSDNGFAPYVGVKDLEKQGHFPSGPLRGYKADVYEGGHRVPFIVRWPQVIRAGQVSHQLVHQADIMATLAAIWNEALPDNAGEDSFNLLPLLQGQDQAIRPHAISCACNGIPSLRVGSWKLVFGPDKGDEEVQLYDLEADLGEKHNLAAKEPERVTEMRTLMESLIIAGRSTPGAKQKNDLRVTRYPK